MALLRERRNEKISKICQKEILIYFIKPPGFPEKTRPKVKFNTPNA
jgi:hypothetical protein